jgi:aldose 1-epimerase
VTAFGTLPDGRAVEAFIFADGDLTVRILTLGGIVQSLLVPDRDGQHADVVLGFARVEDYLKDTESHGALTGRYANRIAGGRFTLDGHDYRLSQNAGIDTLHGGARGFNRALWYVENANAKSLTLSHVSPDGDQGFPGTLAVTVTYTLADNALQIDFHATTDAPTVLNLCNHAYWDLGGRGSVLDHSLQVNADAFTPMNERFLVTGEIRDVSGTPFDFRKPARLETRAKDRAEPQIKLAGGVDHNFVLHHRAPGDLTTAAVLADDISGRVLEVQTTEPGLQVYTGNSLRSGPNGKNGAPYPRWSGIALETQHFPDSPNQPSSPSTVLRPGETFRSQTRFCFSTRSLADFGYMHEPK